jgi:hypothetical protein
MVKLPPQSEEEINKIRRSSEAEFCFLKKHDVIQKRKILRNLNGDDYEESEDQFMDEGWI